MQTFAAFVKEINSLAEAVGGASNSSIRAKAHNKAARAHELAIKSPSLKNHNQSNKLSKIARFMSSKHGNDTEKTSANKARYWSGVGDHQEAAINHINSAKIAKLS
jgi:hypothetical protein